VSALEARVFVAREANPDDMREELLALTREGRRVYEALAPEALAFADRLAAAFAPGERERFLDMLERLDRHVRSLAGERTEAAS
jgi:DNA-binding MarR family transcriptional regulator